MSQMATAAVVFLKFPCKDYPGLGQTQIVLDRAAIRDNLPEASHLHSNGPPGVLVEVWRNCGKYPNDAVHGLRPQMLKK